MNWKRARLIAGKELMEMKRDKRVVTSALMMPILLIFVFLFLFGMIQKSVTKQESIELHVVSASKDHPIVRAFEQSGKFKIKEISSLDQGEKLVRDGKARIALSFSPFPPADPNNPSVVLARYDASEVKSEVALRVIEGVVEGVNKKSLETVLAAKSIPKVAAEPFKVEAKKVEIKEALGTSMILAMIPYLIVLWAFYGGMGIVGDMIAGEKEKQTLETLLISPVNRAEVALGKFMALALLCLISSLTVLVGILIIGKLNLPLTRGLFPQGVSISLASLGAIFAVLVPLVALFAAGMIAVSTYAKNTREAQTHLTLMSFLVLLPAVFGQLVGITDIGKSVAVKFVPVLNSSTTIRNALLGKLDGFDIAAAAGINLVLAAIALWIAVMLFRKESVLTRV